MSRRLRSCFTLGSATHSCLALVGAAAHSTARPPSPASVCPDAFAVSRWAALLLTTSAGCVRCLAETFLVQIWRNAYAGPKGEIWRSTWPCLGCFGRLLSGNVVSHRKVTPGARLSRRSTCVGNTVHMVAHHACLEAGRLGARKHLRAPQAKDCVHLQRKIEARNEARSEGSSKNEPRNELEPLVTRLFEPTFYECTRRHAGRSQKVIVSPVVCSRR